MVPTAGKNIVEIDSIEVDAAAVHAYDVDGDVAAVDD